MGHYYSEMRPPQSEEEKEQERKLNKAITHANSNGYAHHSSTSLASEHSLRVCPECSAIVELQSVVSHTNWHNMQDNNGRVV